MKKDHGKGVTHAYLRGAAAGLLLLASPLALGQVSPFNTGANSLVAFALGIATPIAILIVIGLGLAAAVGRISWGFAVGVILGIAIIFGAPQIVPLIRGWFAV